MQKCKVAKSAKQKVKSEWKPTGRIFKTIRLKWIPTGRTFNLLNKICNNGLDVPTRHILDSRGAVPTKTAADAKTAIQEIAKYSQNWHNGTSRGRSTETSDGLAAI
ncbi:hypothetical protein Tco_0810286 [Tanacetum coccineum]